MQRGFLGMHTSPYLCKVDANKRFSFIKKIGGTLELMSIIASSIVEECCL